MKTRRERFGDVPLLVGYGGDTNSFAVLIGLHALGIRPDLITFADTGDEKPETYEHLKFVEAWLPTIGFPLLTRVKKGGRTGDNSLEEECLRRETMPSRAFGMSSCAMRWKIEPQEKFLNHWPPARDCWARGKKPVKILGYDGGELRRAKIHEDAKLRYWYPLIEWEWDRERCEVEILSRDLPLPPKSACFYCPSSTKTEVLRLAEEHPDLFERAVHMEQVALESERHDLRSIKGLGRHWSWKAMVEADEATRRKLPEAPVESCLICVDQCEE